MMHKCDVKSVSVRARCDRRTCIRYCNSAAAASVEHARWVLGYPGHVQVHNVGNSRKARGKRKNGSKRKMYSTKGKKSFGVESLVHRANTRRGSASSPVSLRLGLQHFGGRSECHPGALPIAQPRVAFRAVSPSIVLPDLVPHHHTPAFRACASLAAHRNPALRLTCAQNVHRS